MEFSLVLKSDRSRVYHIRAESAEGAIRSLSRRLEIDGPLSVVFLDQREVRRRLRSTWPVDGEDEVVRGHRWACDCPTTAEPEAS